MANIHNDESVGIMTPVQIILMGNSTELGSRLVSMAMRFYNSNKHGVCILSLIIIPWDTISIGVNEIIWVEWFIIWNKKQEID